MDTTDRFARLAETPFTTTDARGLSPPDARGKLREIFDRRDLLGLLIRRDLQARYRDSVLGFLWTLIRPIMQFLMYYLVLGQFLRAAEGIPQTSRSTCSPGLTIYSFFAEMVLGSTARSSATPDS